MSNSLAYYSKAKIEITKTLCYPEPTFNPEFFLFLRSSMSFGQKPPCRQTLRQSDILFDRPLSDKHLVDKMFEWHSHEPASWLDVCQPRFFGQKSWSQLVNNWTGYNWMFSEKASVQGKGRLSTFDLLVLTSLNQFLFIKNIILIFYQISDLIEEVNCTQPSPQLVFLAQSDSKQSNW